jgi:hypothetical protein
MRINLVTKDAAPDLKPDCVEDDADPVAASTCKDLHLASFDIIGQLA